MRDRWEQIEQNAREFWLDVHAVTSNFFGEQDWKWLIQNDNQHQAGDDAQPATGLWERFKKEMMTNARFYSEDSAFEDRMILGVGAAAYAIPYGLGRLFYDGTLNLVEYATWRVTDHAYTPSHPEGRKKNGHALGAPLAAPFVALAVTIEAIARVAGISAYGGHIIQAAGKRSANLSKYTRGIFGKYSAESIQKNVDGLSARPQSAWDIADRCAYVTLPGVIAFADILGAVALTSTFGLGEGVGRSLGVSRRGAASITLASKVSANIMSRYVGKCTGTYDAVSLKKDCGIIFGKINNGWEALDALGAFTLPLAIGLVETSAALALTGTFGGTEILGRVIGISAYGGHIIQAAGKRSANLSKYTRGIFGKYSAESIQKNVDGLSARPQSAWDIADRCAYVTLPGVIAFADILGAVALTSTFGLGEGVGRSLGVSRRGAASITLASKVSANIMSRYVGKCTGTYDAVSLKKDCGIIFGKINNGWEALDALGAFTLPLAIGLVETSAALALTGTFGGTEILGRVIGISAYGGHIIQAAGKSSANLSKYTRGIFGKYSAESIQKNVDGLSARPQSAWDIADRCAYVTLPGVIAFAEILGAVALTSTFGLGEGVGRSLGVSRRGAASITLASKVSANIMSRYVGKCTGTYDAVSLKKDCGIIFGKINNGWEALDALGAFTLPLTIGLVEASAA